MSSVVVWSQVRILKPCVGFFDTNCKWKLAVGRWPLFDRPLPTGRSPDYLIFTENVFLTSQAPHWPPLSFRSAWKSRFLCFPRELFSDTADTINQASRQFSPKTLPKEKKNNQSRLNLDLNFSPAITLRSSFIGNTINQLSTYHN